jgi:hypothetical protein
MKVKLLVFAALLLALASMSYAQGFCAFIYDGEFPMRDACTNGNPVPDGTMMYIYWDSNSNGPDATDPLAPLCNDPPSCSSGAPTGSVNYNQMPINSGEWGLDAGEFFPDRAFCSVGDVTNPPRFYIRLPLANGVTWTSRVMTFVSGPGNDTDLGAADWTCTFVNLCVTSPSVMFNPIAPEHSGGQTAQTACINICHNTPNVTVCVFPLGQGHVPRVMASNNCTCEPTQAAGYLYNGDVTGPWVWDASNGGEYCQTISLGPNGTEGCILLTFDFILAASVTDVHALPGDNSVTVGFRTASETNMSGFEILRGTQLVKRLDATNNASGSTYSYTDNSALNGTVYTYNVVAVDAIGNRTSYPTEAVAPSELAANVTEYALHQNYPNPFNPSTSIRFDLVEKNFVSLKIYNTNGQVVATVASREFNKGVQIVNFDATNLTSGLYFYTVKVGNVYSATKKMLLVK